MAEKQKSNIRELKAEDFENYASARDYSFRNLKDEPSAPAAEKPEEKGKRKAKKEKKLDLSFMPSFKGRDENMVPVNSCDFTIIACVLLLAFIGVVMVTSSGYYYAYTYMGDSMYFFRKQLLWLGFSVPVLLLAWIFPMNLLKKLSLLGYVLSVVMCVLVLFIGKETNGSTRWIYIGPLSFQPCELAKIAVALYMSVLVDEHRATIKSFKTFLMLLVVLLIPTFLIIIENLTSGIIVAVIGVTIMFIGGCRFLHFLLLGGPLVGILVLFVILPLYKPEMVALLPGFVREILEKYLYRTERIMAWIDPWKYAYDEGYQTVQSLYAVGSGGFFGRGLGNSLQKLGFIPEAHNDIIFAVICEELGLFGAGIVVLLYVVLVWHGFKLSANLKNRFCSYLVAGITMQIGVQALLNIAVNTNILPATGVSLPFISYGGSSLLFLMISVGLVLNASRFEKTQ